MEVMTDSSTTVEDRDMVVTHGPREATLALIDNAIRECAGRDIVSASEMMDILLDIRSKFTSAQG